MTLYEKIKFLCELKDLSIRECERRANVGNGTIAGWQNSSPTLKSLGAVSKVLDVPISELLEA